uniref:RAN binding protein 2 n=1 Tax=Mastacembelus armatus TaxID=205130 RepID=A0A7N8YBK4_9TELE
MTFNIKRFNKPRKKELKGFLFAKLYFEAKEYELAKRHVSEYLRVQERDPKAHKFLGQLYEREGDISKAVGCYKRSVDLNPAQRDLVLKVAELLVSKDECDSRAEFWVEKAAKLLPGNPAVFNLKERLLSRQGQQGWSRLLKLLEAELATRPADAHMNVRLVQLLCQHGQLDEAIKHCLAAEKRGMLNHSLDWYTVVVHTLQEYLAQSSVSSNEKVCRHLQRELLLAHCSLLRITLSESSVHPSRDALKGFDHAMQTLSSVAGRHTDELCEVFVEMRGHLYLHAATLLLKLAQDRQQTWRAIIDFAALCYLLAYQVPRPKPKMTKREQSAPQLLELLANDRQSQAGHMLLNLSTDPVTLIREVVEAFGNRSGQDSLFELLFGSQASTGSSFIANDDIHSINTMAPELSQLAKCDTGSILLHGGNLQHLSWLGLQWTLLAQRPALRDWLPQLFPRLTLETSRLDTNAPESICLLDLEVFLHGVVFCSHCQLKEMAKISSGVNLQQQQQLYEPRCLPLPLLRLLTTDRQREWWDAIYSLIHKRAAPGMSAKLRMIVQHGLNTLRAIEKHGLQPALAIHWAQCLIQTGDGVNSYYDQKEYIARSVHYWKVVLPMLERIKNRRSIPEPLDPLFIHFPSRDIQVSSVKGYEEEAKIAYAALLDIEGKTEEAIATLETINNMSSVWHLAQVNHWCLCKISSNSSFTILSLTRYFKLLKVKQLCNHCLHFISQLPVSMEEVVDLLNDVNQQLEDIGENGRRGPAHSSPAQPTETNATISHIKFSSPSPSKSLISPSKRLISPKTPPHWVEDQKSLLQMLCQQVEAHNSSGNTGSPHKMYGESYGAEGLQEAFTPVQSYHGAPLTVATTGPSVYYNQSPAYNSQYLLRTAANVTPTKSTSSTTTTTSGFSFSMPIPAGGFKFGIQDTAKETHSTVKQASPSYQNPLIAGKPNTFSFADLAKSTGGDFQFGQKDPNFKGFSGAGEQVFSSFQATPTKTDVSNEQDEDDMYKTEENDDIQFEPVVQIPEKVDLVTGEEDEQVLYSQRVKLFRFDSNTSQWKERGVGTLKFLKNNTNGKLRVLMRREQVLKVCANHWITTTMNLKPLAGSDKAWIWMANDVSDGDAKLEQLAAKFKSPELAEEFKEKFEECQRLLLDIPLQTPHKLVDTGRTAHLIQKAEEMKSGLKDLKFFLTDEKTKIQDDDHQADITTSSNVSGLVIKAHGETTGPTLEWDNYDLQEDALDDSSVYASPIASSPLRKNLFRFGESTGGFNFSFQPGISPSKSPKSPKLNQSRASVGTDDEQDVTQDEERDGQYFEPVVPLPDLVEISTGEENEQVVFSHRAKLYRYDKELGQWKERGIGDLKILQNYETKRVRLIMRRDQVLKICANHWINAAMKLEPMKGAEKAWVWSAMDFAEAGEGNIEQLAVRFKLQDTANTFKQVFEEAKIAQQKEELMTPVTSRVASSQDSGPAESTKTATTVCGKAAIAVLDETTKECTKLSPDSKSGASSSQSPVNPSKTVVSPPKFVFGADSLQKFFGTSAPKSHPEAEVSGSDCKAKGSGHPAKALFAAPAFKIPERGKTNLLIYVKYLSDILFVNEYHDWCFLFVCLFCFILFFLLVGFLSPLSCSICISLLLHLLSFPSQDSSQIFC